jgi:hypothetical protein
VTASTSADTASLALEPSPRAGHRFSNFALLLAAIVAVGFVIRVVYILVERRDFLDEFVVGADPFRVGDAYLYQRGAELLADGKGFINPYQYDIFHITQEDASHVPLFMLWLWVPSVLGITSATAHALWSAVLGAGTIAIVGLAGREMVGPRVGLIAAAFTAVYPNVFSHDGFLQSETMAIFTTTLAVWMAYRFIRRPTLWSAVWLAAACGLATMSRSELALLVPVLLLPVVLRERSVDLGTRFRWLGAGAIALALIVGPWIVFNLTRFEKPVLLSDNFGYTLLTATCDATYYGPSIGYWDFGCAEPVYERIDAPRNDRSVNEIEFRDEALDYIRDHKGRLPAVTLARWARYFGIWDLTHDFDQVNKDRVVEGRDDFVAWGGALMFFALAALSVVGIVALRRRRVALLPVLAPIICSLIAVTITFYTNRYRASAETAFCLLAAVGVDALLRRGRKDVDAAPAGAPVPTAGPGFSPSDR